jgi:hypothetical protein
LRDRRAGEMLGRAQDFHASGHKGMIGCALPLIPMKPENPDSADDRAAFHQLTCDPAVMSKVTTAAPRM